MIKAIGYIRISDRDNTRNGDSLQKQAELIQAWAKYHAIMIGEEIELEIIEDRAISGARATREGFLQLKEKLKSKDYTYFVIRDLSRLARDAWLTLDFFKRIVYKHEINFVSLEEGIDTKTPIGKFLLTLHAGLAQLYRDQISAKCIANNKKRRKKGEHLGGHIPYGFNREGKVLISNSEEQGIIQIMGALREEGRSFKEIARHLNSKFIPTKNKRHWHSVSVQRILEKKLSRL